MTEDSGKARGVVAVLTLLALVALNLTLLIHAPTDEFVKTQLNVLNGALLAQLVVIISFYFGTSSGAKTLSATQAEIAKTATGTGPGSALAGATPTGTVTDPVAVTEVKKPSEDAGLVELRKLVLDLNPAATEDDIQRAWAGLKRKPVDIAT